MSPQKAWCQAGKGKRRDAASVQWDVVMGSLELAPMCDLSDDKVRRGEEDKDRDRQTESTNVRRERASEIEKETDTEREGQGTLQESE